VDRDVPVNGARYLIHAHGQPVGQRDRKFFNTSEDTRRTITGYACGCTSVPGAGMPEQEPRLGSRYEARTAPGIPPTRPAVVLDPFGGTGTTALVASAYGRVGITVDRSADYCRLAQWRVRDPGERARARDMPKPPPVPGGMEPLFTMDAHLP
jgi:hypothetical protein